MLFSRASSSALLRAARPRAVRWLPAATRALSSDALSTSASGKGDLSTETAPHVDAETMEAFTGTPAHMLESRVVKIYQQAQTVQNATQNMIPWRIQWEDDQTQRWTNPLMGWTSTSDPLSNTHMTVEFATAEDAARFCQQNGWKYEITASAPNKEILNGPKKYADNFKWKGPPGRAHGRSTPSFPDLYIPPPPPPPPPKS